jgi:hypothetical protein
MTFSLVVVHGRSSKASMTESDSGLESGVLSSTQLQFIVSRSWVAA